MRGKEGWREWKEWKDEDNYGKGWINRIKGKEEWIKIYIDIDINVKKLELILHTVHCTAIFIYTTGLSTKDENSKTTVQNQNLIVYFIIYFIPCSCNRVTFFSK